MPVEEGERGGSIGATFCGFFRRHERASVGGFLTLYAACALVASTARALWFDEMGTFIVASQPTIRRMLAAEPPDGQPPLYYVMARASMRLFGQNAVALRLPALIAFIVAVFCVYLFVRRGTEPVYGLLAAATLCAGPAAHYSMEARPYSLLLAGATAALVCWQSAALSAETHDDAPSRRLLALAGLSLAIALAILSHAYGVFYIAIPLGLAEGVRMLHRRRLDFPVVGACLLGFSALVITIPIVHESRQALFGELGNRPVGVAAATVLRLYRDSGSLVENSPIRLAALLAVLSLCVYRKNRTNTLGNGAGLTNEPGRESSVRGARIPLHEIAAVAGLTALLGVAWILARFLTHYYYWRYGIGSAAGVAILTAWLVWSLPFRRVLAVALLACMTLLLFPPPFFALFAPRPSFDRSELLNRGDPSLDIVVASALEFPSIWFYSSPGTRKRLHYIADRQFRGSLADPIPEITIAGHASRHTLPMPLDELPGFVASHRSFLLYASEDGADREWLPAELRRRGYQLTLLGSYRYEHPDLLFLVAAPK